MNTFSNTNSLKLSLFIFLLTFNFKHIAFASDSKPQVAKPSSPEVIRRNAEKNYNKMANDQFNNDVKSKKIRPQKVKITLSWNKKNFNLPIKVYELSNSMNKKLREHSNTIDIKKELLILGELKSDGVSYIHGENYKMYALVVENKSNLPIWFFASPHSIKPIAEGIGAKFTCLCRGEIYRIKPKHSWYIVMKVQLYSANRSEWFEFTHNLIGIKEKDVPKADRMNQL